MTPAVKSIDLSFKVFFNEFVADAFMVGTNNGELKIARCRSLAWYRVRLVLTSIEMFLICVCLNL